MPDLIVIGGGISGLSAAHFAAKAGREVLVLEQAATLGGCVHSSRTPAGYWHELGAHTCYNSYSALLSIIEERGLELVPRKKAPFRLWVDGELRSVVSQLSVLPLLVAGPRLLFSTKDGKTVRDFWSRIVGARNYERVFGPLFAAVPSQRADDFPADMLFKKRARRKDVPRSYTLAGGLSSLVEALARAPRVTVRTGAEGVRVEREGAGFSVTLADGTVRARQLMVATPPDAAARLVAPVLPAAAEALAGIKVCRVKTVGVALEAAATTRARFAGVIPLDGTFYSCVSRDPVPDPSWRGFALHLDPATRREEALALLSRLLAVKTEALGSVVEREVALPSPVLGHAQGVKALDGALAGGALGLTGNYFAGLSLEDCVQRSRDEVARLCG